MSSTRSSGRRADGIAPHRPQPRVSDLHRVSSFVGFIELVRTDPTFGVRSGPPRVSPPAAGGTGRLRPRPFDQLTRIRTGVTPNSSTGKASGSTKRRETFRREPCDVVAYRSSPSWLPRRCSSREHGTAFGTFEHDVGANLRAPVRHPGGDESSLVLDMSWPRPSDDAITMACEGNHTRVVTVDLLAGGAARPSRDRRSSPAPRFLPPQRRPGDRPTGFAAVVARVAEALRREAMSVTRLGGRPRRRRVHPARRWLRGRTRRVRRSSTLSRLRPDETSTDDG